MGRAQTAYDRAQRLHEAVAQHMRTVDDQTEKHGPKRMRATAAPAIAQPVSPVFAIGRNPEAARQAFIASLVFGTPKGLEP
jgi:hypothetical protein